MRRRAVFMDIDGTLILEGGAPSERVKAAIRAAREKGHLFFLCTGRSRGFLPPPLRDTDYLDGFVCGAGTYGFLHGQALFHQRIPRDVLRRVCRYFLAAGRACIFEGEERVYITPDQGADIPEGFEGIRAEDDFETRFPQANITKLTICSAITCDDLALLSPWFSVCNMGGFFEAILLGNSKATGMEKMLAAVGIPREDSIAIGDNHNDLPMIEYAGFGVAMGNACDALKAAADAVTACCAEDGVACMIEDYVMTGR